MKLYAMAITLLMSLSAIAGSKDCLFLKRSKNGSGKSFGVVFVPSNFADNLDEFERQVREGWAKISVIAPLSDDIDTMTVAILKKELRGGSICTHKIKEGMTESEKTLALLDCQYMKAVQAGQSCIPSAKKKTTVVLHNSEGKFIRGNTSSNLIVLSNNSTYPNTIAHELGHGIFDLSDEYTYGGPPDAQNCSSVLNQCSKWQDLIDAGMATCEKGCRNNMSLVNGNFLMKDSRVLDFGHANNRLICCRYKKVTGEFPAYCDEYRNVGEGLEAFCR